MMRFLYATITVLILSLPVWSQGVGINETGSAPSESAILDVSSTKKGFLPPRMTSLQRDAIENPQVGLVIYNLSTNCLNFFVGDGWNESCGTTTNPIVDALLCNQIVLSDTPIEGEPFVFSAIIPYSNGNGMPYNTMDINSSLVNGLVAQLISDTLENGDGSLFFQVSGTAETHGTALFAFNFGGTSCSFEVGIAKLNPNYPANSVHCVTPTLVVEVLNPETGRVWMDRNLGALELAYNNSNPNSRGDLYQWGRRSDGHQCRNSSVVSNQSSSPQPTHDDFIIVNFPLSDWLSTPNTSLWNGLNADNNPCPSGFRIPTSAEWISEYQSWDNGTNSSAALTSRLKLPAVGNRFYTTGFIFGSGESAKYWSSSIQNDLSLALDFSEASSQIIAQQRASGCAVRCIKD